MPGRLRWRLRSTSVKIPVPGSAVAFYPRSLPTNAYVAFGGSNYQIEVFDPDPARMRKLIASGAIQPVASNAPGAVSGETVNAVPVSRLDLLPSTARASGVLGGSTARYRVRAD